MPRISRFSTAYPDIDIRLNASAEAVDLTRGVIDFDIRYGTALQATGTAVEPFPQETIVVLCAPSLLEGAHPLRAPSDLRYHALIHSEVNLFTWRDWLKQHPEMPIDLERGHRFDRSFMAISAAVDGRGVCLESKLLVERELESGRLVMPFGPERNRMQCHSLVYLKSRARIPKLRAFRDWLFQALNETAA